MWLLYNFFGHRTFTTLPSRVTWFYPSRLIPSAAAAVRGGSIDRRLAVRDLRQAGEGFLGEFRNRIGAGGNIEAGITLWMTEHETLLTTKRTIGSPRRSWTASGAREASQPA